MKRSEERILTTHVGSLVRPPELLANLQSRGGEADEATLAAAVRHIVARQVSAGIDIVNDGEFGKSSWAWYVLERLDGFEVREDELRPLQWLGRDRARFAEFFAEQMPRALQGMPTEACVGPVVYRGQAAIERALRSLAAAAEACAVSRHDVFMTAVAPASTAHNGVNEYYETEHDYVFAVAEALREEYQAIYEAGFLVQVDDAVLANMYDALICERPERYREWAELRVEALNHALRDIPEESIRYHVCFGSWHVPHVADAPLSEIVDLVQSVRAQAYLIEAANVRHEHEWRIWETTRLRDGKILVPGVVTHHTVTVEHPELVADRIMRFAKLVGRENVIAGTDCGFAQMQDIARVHPSVMWAKLEALVEGARIASARLWRR